MLHQGFLHCAHICIHLAILICSHLHGNDAKLECLWGKKTKRRLERRFGIIKFFYLYTLYTNPLTSKRRFRYVLEANPSLRISNLSHHSLTRASLNLQFSHHQLRRPKSALKFMILPFTFKSTT